VEAGEEPHPRVPAQTETTVSQTEVVLEVEAEVEEAEESE
jgi:hypothetical protein